MNWASVYRHRWTFVYAPIVLVALCVFAWLSLVVFPPAPNSITITSGPMEGMYHQHALRYAEFFRNRGLDVNIVTSAGSEQNIERLRDIQNPSQVGFVQGGFGLLDRTLGHENRTSIQTLANVDIEPVWIFSRIKNIDSLEQLQGMRVSIGQVGSGSRLMAVKLLEQVRIEPKDLIVSETTGLNAVVSLQEAQIDAAIFVAAPSAPLVKAMLHAKGIHLVQLKRSAALTERIPYLEPRLVAQGMLDNVSVQPANDMILLTTVASLVASENLHPTLKRLATAAAIEIHREATPLSKAGDFPNLKRIDFSSAPDARSTLLHGLPWLERHFSLTLAQWIWRIFVIGLPLMLAAWVMCRLVPAYLRWTLESYINRWYGELKFIEHDLEQAKLSGLDFSRHHSQLRAIETALGNFDAPQEYMKRLYMLRHHVDFVRQKLVAKRGR